MENKNNNNSIGSILAFAVTAPLGLFVVMGLIYYAEYSVMLFLLFGGFCIYPSLRDNYRFNKEQKRWQKFNKWVERLEINHVDFNRTLLWKEYDKQTPVYPTFWDFKVIHLFYALVEFLVFSVIMYFLCVSQN